MKLLIASDIHGDIECLERLMKVFEDGEYDRLLLLGDLIYHGPRNDLPCAYAPKKVIALLNKYADKILAVRGNCDTEVDQMVLDFPIMSDYALLNIEGVTIYATHGHIYNAENPPKLRQGDLLLHGHTHLLGVTDIGNGSLCINPGSVSLPKGGNPKSYAALCDGSVSIFKLDGELISNVKIK